MNLYWQTVLREKPKIMKKVDMKRKELIDIKKGSVDKVFSVKIDIYLLISWLSFPKMLARKSYARI